MAGRIFDYLNDPLLVASFQKTFGVTHKPAIDTEDNSDDSDNLTSASDLRLKNGGVYDTTGLLEEYDQSVLAHSYNLRSRKFQTHRRTASEYSTASSRDGNADKDYVVKWSFFYYLFHIGAGLGNEMFYCCFFPYWFWNVDGYVCRRLVLTWCIIMYIGQALKDIIRYIDYFLSNTLGKLNVFEANHVEKNVPRRLSISYSDIAVLFIYLVGNCSLFNIVATVLIRLIRAVQ